MPVTRSTASLALVFVALPVGAGAQLGEPAGSVHHVEDCRLAAQVLTLGHPHPRWRWAIETIPRCTEDGGEILARVWSDPPADSMALARLAWNSVRLSDARVLDAVLAAARSEEAPRLTRLRALQVLTAYIDRSRVPRLEDLEPVEPWWERPGLGRWTHTVTHHGSVPPGPDTPRRVLAGLAALADTAADPYVAYAAAHIRDELRRVVEGR